MNMCGSHKNKIKQQNEDDGGERDEVGNRAC